MKIEEKSIHSNEGIFADDPNPTEVEDRQDIADSIASNGLSNGLRNDQFHTLTDEDIYDALQDEVDLICFDDAGIKDAVTSGIGEVRSPAIGLGYLKTDPARNIERLVRALEKDTKPPFELLVDAAGKEVIKTNPLGKFFGFVMDTHFLPNEPHTFSEEVELVFKEREALNIETCRLQTPNSRDPETGKKGYELFNELIENVAIAMRDEDFIARRRRRRERARRNYLSAKRYTAAIFKRCARLEVLRIDFGYRDWTKQQNNLISMKTIQEMRRDLMHLLNNRRSNRLFKAMVGYIAKIEHGTTKGYHAHALFFFDSSKVQRETWRAGEIGKYWNNVVTQGEGLFYNCNAHKAKYRRLGIGRIEDSDAAKRANLLLAIAYITKADQYLTVRGDGGRTFFKGVAKPRTTTGGRPRRGGPDEHQS